MSLLRSVAREIVRRGRAGTHGSSRAPAGYVPLGRWWRGLGLSDRVTESYIASPRAKAASRAPADRPQPAGRLSNGEKIRLVVVGRDQDVPLLHDDIHLASHACDPRQVDAGLDRESHSRQEQAVVVGLGIGGWWPEDLKAGTVERVAGLGGGVLRVARGPG